MGMPQITRYWTRENVLALPDDGNRYELVDGELLVSPSPRPLHQIALAAVYDRLSTYVRAHGLGLLLFSPADLDLLSGQLVQPDLFVVAGHDGRALREWTDVGIPLLVIEVLSPSTARHDRITKRRKYQRVGVPEYWIVDLDARAIERWRPEDERPEVRADDVTWQPPENVPVFTMELAELFQAIHGGEVDP